MWKVDDVFAESVWTLLVEAFGCSPTQRRDFVVSWVDEHEDSQQFRFLITANKYDIPMYFTVENHSMGMKNVNERSWVSDDISTLLQTHYDNELRCV